MKRRVSKSRMLIVLFLIAALFVTACAGKKDVTNDSSATDLPNTVSISMFDRGDVSSDEGTYEENRWVEWIREQSGLDVSIVPVPRWEAQAMLNVLLASNQAPDLLVEYDRGYIGKLVTQGAIQPIGEYIEKYSTTYKKYLEENPDLLPHITFDGEIYAMTTKRPITAIANHGMWVRQDWLDELNLEAPTTIEELLEVAVAFKNHFPDSTPIVGANMRDVLAAFYAAINHQWYLEDGQMRFGPTLDRYGDIISLQEQLYEQGLIDREFLTDSNNQRSNQLWTTGKAGFMLGQWGTGATDLLMKDLFANVPDAKPAPLEAVASSHGKFGTYQESSPFLYVAFNKNMTNPKAAIEYLDWILEEGWFTLLNGEEGVHYEMADGLPRTLDPDQFRKEVFYAREYAVLRNEIVEPEHLILQAADDEMSQRIAALNATSLETVLRTPFRRDTPYQPVFDKINEIRATFDKYAEEIVAAAIMQGAPYDSEWALAEIRREWERLGGKEAEELAQQWYEQNKDSF